MRTWKSWDIRSIRVFLEDPSISPILHGLLQTMPSPDRFGDPHRLLGTRGTRDWETQRAYTLLEYGVRQFLPTAMDAAERHRIRGKFPWLSTLVPHIVAVVTLPEIDSKEALNISWNLLRSPSFVDPDLLGPAMLAPTGSAIRDFTRSIDLVRRMEPEDLYQIGYQCGRGIDALMGLARARILKMYPSFVEEMIG